MSLQHPSHLPKAIISLLTKAELQAFSSLLRWPHELRPLSKRSQHDTVCDNANHRLGDSIATAGRDPRTGTPGWYTITEFACAFTYIISRASTFQSYVGSYIGFRGNCFEGAIVVSSTESSKDCIQAFMRPQSWPLPHPVGNSASLHICISNLI